jgi:putative transposase
VDDRKAITAILYVLRTGCQWKALPRSLGAGSTVHHRFQQWFGSQGIPEDVEGRVIGAGRKEKLDWAWQCMDGAMTKAPLGGEKTGKNPTDRAKSGVKRSLLTEGHGIPIAVAVEGANCHDKRLVEGTLRSMVVQRPRVTKNEPQNMCMDKGYDYPDTRQLVSHWGYTARIETRGEEVQEKQNVPGYRAQRWVVERTHSWMNRYRRLLVRWEKKVANYLAMLHLACALITFRAGSVFG